MKYFKTFIICITFTCCLLDAFSQPTANFSFNPAIPCSGAVVTFTNSSTGASSYLWEFGDGTTSTQANPTHSFNTLIGNSTQQFFVKLTARSGGQNNNVTKPVDVLQPPDPQIIDPTNWPAFSQCGGTNNTLNLTINNGSTTINTSYQIDWGDATAPFSGGAFASLNHTYTGFGAYDLVFSLTGANGCTNSKIYQVFNGSNPSLGVSSPGGTTGCVPLSLTFDITGTAGNFGTSYKFQFNDGTTPDEFTQSTLPATLSHTFNQASCFATAPDLTFKLVAIATNSCGIQKITVEPIDINREPFAKILPSSDTVCLGDPVTFTNQTIPPCGGNPSLTDYTWDIDGTSIPVGTSTGNQVYTFASAGVKTVKLTATNSTILSCNGGVSTAQIQILVVDASVPDKPTGITGPAEICQGEQGVIFSVGDVPNATSYTWNLPTGATILSGSGTKTITVNFAPDAVVGSVGISVRGDNPCKQGLVSDPFMFTLKPLPSLAGDIDGIPSLCLGKAAELTYLVTSISNADVYVWSVPTGSTIISGDSTNSITVSFPSNATSGNVSVYGKNSCGSGTSSALFVEVKPIPSNASAITGPTSACEGDEITLTVPPISNADLYLWTMEDGSSLVLPTNTVTHTITGSTSTATFKVFGVNPCGQGDTATLTIPVYPAPKTNFAPKDHCLGKPVPLVDTSITSNSDITSWDWDFGDGYSSKLAEPVHVFADSGSYKISLVVLSNKGCRTKKDSTIIVNPVPEANFRPIPLRTSILSPQITFKDSSFFTKSWLWDFGDSTSATERNPIHNYAKTGNFKVKEYASFGTCIDSAMAEVVVFEGLYVPNAFMPGIGGSGGGSGGGEGTGSFKPFFGVTYSGGGYSFMVFNRWGEMVFSTTNTDEGWNGTVRNTGKDAPIGIYIWKLTYKEANSGKTKSRTGNIMLLR